MVFVYTLVKIALVLFIGYVAFIFIYRIFYKTTLDDAEKAVNALIKEWCNNLLLHKNPVSAEPIPDDILVNKLFDVLNKINQLDTDITKWQFSNNFYGFPALQFNVIALEDTDFKLFCKILEETTQNYLELCEYIPLVHVFCEKCGDTEYLVYVCYACFEISQTALRNFMINKSNIAKKEIKKKIAPVINDALEKELEDMKNGRL